MDEYTLAGISLERVKNKDYAICRIMWDLPKCLREDESNSVVESGFGTLEKIDESIKRKFEFEYPNEKRSAQIVDKLSMAFSSRAGYRFMPTDQQVIELYLQAKANGLPLPSDAILDKDLYGKWHSLGCFF
ncbi:NAC domain superfamily [Forsythia ovata]|uniref:NAC domain superfamily n=1 Tax=Forsythia ovata TaxID=205694 RepID=A0ABD1V0V5_9LAMI